MNNVLCIKNGDCIVGWSVSKEGKEKRLNIITIDEDGTFNSYLLGTYTFRIGKHFFGLKNLYPMFWIRFVLNNFKKNCTTISDEETKLSRVFWKTF